MAESDISASAIQSLVLPDTITTIATQGISASQLTSLVIPASVASIAGGAFYGCANIKNFEVAEGNENFSTALDGTILLTDAGKTVLAAAPAAEFGEVDFASEELSSVTAVADYAFRGASKVTAISNLDAITSFGDSAFESCVSLSNMILPNGLVFLKANAFKFSGLEKIEIPQTINYIGSHAFCACDELKLVSFKGVPNTIGSGVFDYCHLERIQIPKGSKNAFMEKLFGIKEELFEET